MPSHIEVGRDGRMTVVSSSSTKKKSKPRQETTYVDVEDRERVLQLETFVAELQGQIKTLINKFEESERLVKDWRDESHGWEGKYNRAIAANEILEDKVSRRNEELRKNKKEIGDLSDEKKNLKDKIEKFKTEVFERGDRISVLNENNRVLKDTNAGLKDNNASLKSEIEELTRALLADKGLSPRRAEEAGRRQPYDNDHWNRVGQLPLREDYRRRWGARDYDSDR